MPICPRGHESAALDGYCDECGHPVDAQQHPLGAPPMSPGTGSAPVSGYGYESAPLGFGGGQPPQPSGGYGSPAAPAGERCLVCDTPRTALARFCEACGHEYPAAGQAAAPQPTYQDPPPSYGGGGYPAQPPGYDPGYGSVQTGGGTGGTGSAGGQGHPYDGSGYQHYPQTPVAQPPQPPQPVYAWTLTTSADPEYFDRVMAIGGPDASMMRFPPYYEPCTYRLSGERMRVGRGTGVEIDLSGPPRDPGISHLHAVFIAQPDGTWALVDPGAANGISVNGAPTSIEPNVAVRLADGDRVHIGAWTTLYVRIQAV